MQGDFNGIWNIKQTCKTNILLTSTLMYQMIWEFFVFHSHMFVINNSIRLKEISINYNWLQPICALSPHKAPMLYIGTCCFAPVLILILDLDVTRQEVLRVPAWYFSGSYHLVRCQAASIWPTVCWPWTRWCQAAFWILQREKRSETWQGRNQNEWKGLCLLSAIFSEIVSWLHLEFWVGN